MRIEKSGEYSLVLLEEIPMLPLTIREEYFLKLESCKRGYEMAASHHDIAGMIDNHGLAVEIKEQIAQSYANSGGRNG